MDAAGAAHGRREGRGHRRASSPRSTGTSVILRRAARCGTRRRARLRERVVDVVEERVRRRLWSDAGDERSGSTSSCRRSKPATTTSVRRRRRAAGAQWRPPDAERRDDVDARLHAIRDRRRRGQRDELERLRAEVAEWRAPVREGRDARHRVHQLGAARSSRCTPRSTSARRRAEALGVPGHVSVHARHPSDRLSRQAVDDAPVRRLRQRERHERSASSSCSSTGRPGSRPRSTSRR